MNKLTIKAVQAAIQAIYCGDPVPNDTLQQIVEQAQSEGFHTFNLEGGYLTFWREKDLQTMEVRLGQLRGFNRPLTDEEVHLLATEGMPNAPAFDPDNVIYRPRTLRQEG